MDILKIGLDLVNEKKDQMTAVLELEKKKFVSCNLKLFIYLETSSKKKRTPNVRTSQNNNLKKIVSLGKNV